VSEYLRGVVDLEVLVKARIIATIAAVRRMHVTREQKRQRRE